MNGIGMSGLARLLLMQKISVSGSDLNPVAPELKELGAIFYEGHAQENVPEGAAVIYSTAVKGDNVEMARAREIGCEVLHRSELLRRIAQTKKPLAVTGTHGKTTTSALLAHLLNTAGLKPSYMVGGILGNSGTNADFQEGDHFVLEADESDGSFLNVLPFGAIVTNAGIDHLDHWGSPEKILEGYKTFLSKVQSSLLLWCYDDANLKALNPKGIGYGFSPDAPARLLAFEQKGFSISYDLSYKGRHYKRLEVALTGRHNALNSAAVFLLALELGADEKALREGLQTFKGVGRRLEKRGEVRAVAVFDDYAHHPTEIKATLRALRDAIGPRRLIAVFEPHRYSRFQALYEDFQKAFKEADLLYITDIYSAGEAQIAGVEPKLPNASYIPRSELLKTLKPTLLPHDVVVTLGAGSITHFSRDLIQALQEEPPRKLQVAVAFGGMSVEHDISILSKEHVARSLRKELYEVREVEVTQDGRWLIGGVECEPTAALDGADVVFPVFHGPFGEDGTVQGMFEILRLPYVGCSHRSAAIAMDKALTKRLALFSGVQTAPFVSLSRRDWMRGNIPANLSQELQLPVFVKASHLGSSIGVVKVECWSKLDAALEEVFRVDDELIVEQGISGREIEFACLGNDPVTVFPPGEVLTGGKFYDFASKYLEGGMQSTCEPDLPEEAIAEGCELARRVYLACGCKGMARVDFFYDRQGRFWLNEINPIPGFTKISLYPKLCERHGLKASDLMDTLITLALQRMRQGVK